jgi:hypothetical protein
MKIDYADDPMLSEHLEQSKSSLFDYFHENYAHVVTTATLPMPLPIQAAPIVAGGSPQKSFTARYRRKEKPAVNELEEYFKLPAEDFDACNPIRWWMGRRAQFPNLFCLARDILCIPGELLLVPNLLTYNLPIWQALLLPSSEFFQEVGTQFLSAVRAFVLIPSGF